MEQDVLYRQIVDGSPDAVILGDAKGIVRLWNAGAEAIFGYTPAEAIGQSMDLIIPERLRGRHWDGYHRVMATGVSRYSTSCSMVTTSSIKAAARPARPS